MIPPVYDILYLRNTDIDPGIWDKSIQRSINPSIYALSWFLNIACPDWEALATDDYSTLMPMPVIRFSGLTIIKQPLFTNLLGIYSCDLLKRDLIAAFLDLIPRHYIIRSYNFNKFNTIENTSFKIGYKTITEMELISSYYKLRANYNDIANNQISNALKSKISVIKSISSHDFLEFAYRFDRLNARKLKPVQVHLLRQILSNSIRFRQGEIFGAYTRENNLCAALFIISFRDHKTIFHIAADHEGLANGAVYLMLDQYLLTNAEKNQLLSYDNPSEPGIQSIFQHLGANVHTFATIRTKFFPF